MAVKKNKRKAAKAGKEAKARAKAGKVNGAEAKPASPGLEFTPAPKSGPNLTLRARNHSQIDRIKRAAGKVGISMNTWAIEVLERAAQAAGVTR